MVKFATTKSQRRKLFNQHIGTGWLVMKSADSELYEVEFFVNRTTGQLCRIGDGQPIFPLAIFEDDNEIKVQTN